MSKFFGALLLCSLMACNETSFSPVSSTEDFKTDPETSLQTNNVSKSTDLNGCDVINVKRAEIKWKLEGRRLSLYVPASSSLGAPYVKFWPNGRHVAPEFRGPTNQWFSVVLDYGKYPNARVDVEVRNQVLYQCDRHFLPPFEIIRPETPEPPVPPSTDPNPPDDPICDLDELAVPTVDGPRCEEPPTDWCENLEGIQEVVPEGYITTLVPPYICTQIPDDCSQVWVVDTPAYDEQVTTCVPQEPLPGNPVVTGFVYKLTGTNSHDRREYACEAVNGPGNSDNYSVHSPAGTYQLSECIPGNGAVDACVFSVDLGEEFDRLAFMQGHSTKVRFDDVDACNITVPGEPIPQPDKCTTETIHHDEVGHFETVCE